MAIGDNFSPSAFSKINNRVKLVNVNEPGDIGTRGRYIGEPTPYGSASIEVSDKPETDWSRFDDLLKAVETCIEDLRMVGAEDFWLLVSLFHDGQCNFGFSKEELERIAALKIEMKVSCYSDGVE